MNKTYLIMAGIAVVSLGVGGAGGYILAEKRLRAHYDEISKRDIENAKQFYKKLHKEDEFETPVKAVEVLIPNEEKSEFAPPEVESSPLMNAAVEAIESYSPEPEAKTGTTQAQVRNVFKDNRPLNREWDHEMEAASRTPNHPYVITHQEFLENDGEFEQSSLTYFEGDDALVDELDAAILPHEVERLVGVDNLTRFGHGSDDNQLVYIRNEKLEIDFEVILNRGKYAEVVLGFRDDAEVDRRQRPQKFRRGDDG